MTGDPRPIPGPEGDRVEFEPLASLADLAEGALLQRLRSNGEAICLIRHEGRVSAVSDICTHQHFSMSQGDLLDDGTLQCAWHGARFDCRTGEVKQVPATSPLPVFEVRVEGDTILVGPRCERNGGKYEASTVKVDSASDHGTQPEHEPVRRIGGSGPR